MIVTVLVVLFLVLVIVGVPIGITIGGLGFIWSIFTGNEMTLVTRRMYYGLNSFTLLAVPLFMLAAIIMNNGDISRKLVDFSKALVGRFKGGLALVNIFVSMIFAGMSGSSQADTAGVGGILMPAMKKDGYKDEVTCGVTASSSTIGVIIPPSIPMLVIGSVVSISIAGMFVGGVIPGIMVGLGQMLVIIFMAKKYGFPPGEKYSVKEVLGSFVHAIPVLIIPLIVLGGIAFGVFTATEAGVIAVFYALILSIITKQMTVKKLWKILKEVTVLASIPMLIVSAGVSLGWIIAYENIPQLVRDTIMSITTNPTLVMLIIAGIVVFFGCFLDNISVILILTPILLPLVTSIGVDPIHFGVVFALGAAIGLITPPVGLCLFVSSTVSGVSLERVIKGTVPFLIAELVVYIIVVIFPVFTTWLPKLLF